MKKNIHNAENNTIAIEMLLIEFNGDARECLRFALAAASTWSANMYVTIGFFKQFCVSQPLLLTFSTADLIMI